jgi:hypothetical protein
MRNAQDNHELGGSDEIAVLQGKTLLLICNAQGKPP